MVLDKLKQLRGLFYRRLKEETKPASEDTLPGFRLDKSSRIVELPSAADVTKINVIYPLLEPFSYANIKWSEEERSLIYNLIEPELSTTKRMSARNSGACWK